MSAITLGLSGITGPPWSRVKQTVWTARHLLGIDTLWTVDHFLGFFPQSIWDKDFAWMADPRGTPHQYFDYQVLLGALAPRAGKTRLAVGVTEPIRRHPVLIAQAFLTLSHLTRRAPILGIGAGERENIEPYGLAFDQPVSVLEEALAIIRLCFDSRGPFDFAGEHFNLDRAVLDLKPAAETVPEIWVAAHGPRMLRLTGEYGDGWYPALPYTPDTYADALSTIRAAAESAGRSHSSFTPGLQMLAVMARTRAEARNMLDHKSIRFTALLAPDYVWQSRGLTHPLGAGFRGMIDFVPQYYERAELEAAIKEVDTDLLADSVAWGTVDDVEEKIRELGEVGLRHVVVSPAAGLISRSDMIYNLRCLRTLSRRLG